MPISRVYLENFRLFQKKDLILSEDKNFIQGLNGSGKTSVLESIETLINGRSFRTSQSKDCINHNSDSFNNLETVLVSSHSSLLSLEYLNPFSMRVAPSLI